MNRGGSWNNNPRNVRSANRNRNAPDNSNNNLGFRLVLPAQHLVEWRLLNREISRFSDDSQETKRAGLRCGSLVVVERGRS